MSLATICRQVAVLVGVQPADVWAGNDDQTAREIVAWVQEAQQRVGEAHDWQRLIADATAATTGDEEQTLTLPPDLDRIVPDSVFLSDPRIRVAGPLTAAEWERRRQEVGLTQPAFTVSGGQLLLRTATGGGPLVLRYTRQLQDFDTDASVSALGGGTSPTTGTPQDAERCIMLCAVTLFRDAKGLEAGSAATQYADSLSRLRARDLPIGPLSMGRRPATPGVNARVASVTTSGSFVLGTSVLG